MRGWMGADGGEMGVEFIGHAIDPVANVPFTQSSTRLHGEPQVLTHNRGGFVSTLNITAVEHSWT
jgi:hypothetical protein